MDKIKTNSRAKTPAPASPGDIALERVWSGRMVFDGELPFPKGVTFLPAAHYAAEVVSLPAGLRLADGAGETVASFAAPEGVEPPFTMHLGVAGRTKAAVFATKNGTTAFSRLDEWPEGFDVRRAEFSKMLSVRPYGGAGPVGAALSPGVGQADVRFVSRGRQGLPYLEGGRMFFTFSERFYGSACGVASFEAAHPERGVRFEGTILFDCGDGLLRNDHAPHVFYDDEAGEWRGWSCNFSTGSDSGTAGRAPGGVNAVWSKESPLRGFCVMKSKPLGLPGMNEDPCCVWDGEARKWRLLVSHFTPEGIRAMMFESERWDGGFVPLSGPVAEDSTGTTIATWRGVRHCLSGSADRRYYIYSYPMLARSGELEMSPAPWGAASGWPHGRGWPAFAELPEGFPFRCVMLTMDRVNFPGIPDPNWTYGALHLYAAAPDPH